MNIKKELYYATRAFLRDNPICTHRVKALTANEKLMPDEIRGVSSRLLYRTLKVAAKKIPFYADIKANYNLHVTEAILVERYPIISKDDLLVNKKLFYPNRLISGPWTIVGTTSGTTGTPLEVTRSLNSVLWENAFLRRHWTWAGYRPGMPRATLRSDIVVPPHQKDPPFWFYNRYNNQLFISPHHLRDEFVGVILDELERFAPYILQAYPSAAYELACHLERNQRTLRVPYVYTGSEPLYYHQRELIEQRFGARIMDFYAMAERVAFAAECEFGNFHVNTDYSYVEIVDEHGHPTSDYGYIVGTTFHNLIMPLIRYKLSDRARWKTGECPCGRPYPMIELMSGRAEDLVYANDGSLLTPLLHLMLKDVKNISRSQVAQVGVDRLEIRVVPRINFSDKDSRKLIQNLHDFVHPDIDAEVVRVADIPRTAAGKYRWVVNEYGDGGRED